MSLQRLHPLSPAELRSPAEPKPSSCTDQADQDEYDSYDVINALLEFSGFPEPYFEKDLVFLKRWQNERRKRVLQEDLLDLEKVIEVKKLSLLMTMVVRRSGSLLSKTSIGQDLDVSHHTVERWLTILENLYYCYRISPWSNRVLAKALKKEQKVYLWDWSLHQDIGGKFENFVASMILKHIHFQEDSLGNVLRLHFLRDREKREIDFLIAQEDGTPVLAVEVKTGKKALSPHIPYFASRLGIPFYQVYLGSDKEPAREFVHHKATILPVGTFCKEILDV